LLQMLRSRRYIAVSLASSSSPATEVRAHVTSSVDSVVISSPARQLQQSLMFDQLPSSVSLCLKSTFHSTTPTSSLVNFADVTGESEYWYRIDEHAHDTSLLTQHDLTRSRFARRCARLPRVLVHYERPHCHLRQRYGRFEHRWPRARAWLD
jgi:hypothetical protein